LKPVKEPVKVKAGADGERAQQSAQILAAWQAAQDAYETAALTANPVEPALVATTVSPQLPRSQSFLQSMRTAGDIASGSDNHGSPVVSAVKGDVASVRTCEWDGEIGISASTRQPAPGELGHKGFALVNSTMVLTPDGWKLADETVGNGKCHRA
jgi:hypothetical protein